jgi:cytochrome c55X
MRSLLLFLGLLTAQISSADISPARQNELMYFVKHDCGSCHGMTLKGGLGPALLPESLAGKPKSMLVATIMDGRPDTAMPPWRPMLKREEALWITEQLQNGTLLQSELALSNKQKDEKSQPVAGGLQ